MKSFFKQSFMLFLTLAFLASSTGVTVFKMVCGSSGKEIVSLQQIKNCCQNKKRATESIEKKCCDFSAQTFKISLLHKTEVKAISFDLPLLQNNFVFSQLMPLKSANTFKSVIKVSLVFIST